MELHQGSIFSRNLKFERIVIDIRSNEHKEDSAKIFVNLVSVGQDVQIRVESIKKRDAVDGGAAE